MFSLVVAARIAAIVAHTAMPSNEPAIVVASETVIVANVARKPLVKLAPKPHTIRGNTVCGRPVALTSAEGMTVRYCEASALASNVRWTLGN